MRLALAFCLMLLSGCGYHLVGQGESNVIPEGVHTANLTTNAGVQGKLLLAELHQLWTQNTSLPALSKKDPQVMLRIEGANNTFIPIAYDASGLAIQYKLSVSGILNMYKDDTLIWSSSIIVVDATVFGDASSNNPSVVEAERQTLQEQLYLQWAQDALARLQSGF